LTAKDGGDLGTFKRGYAPWHPEHSETMKPGEVSDLVKTPAGFHSKAKKIRRVPERSTRLKVKEIRRKVQQWADDLKERADKGTFEVRGTRKGKKPLPRATFLVPYIPSPQVPPAARCGAVSCPAPIRT
jgi:hypothetical protein